MPASYENPKYTGANSLARTTMTGALREYAGVPGSTTALGANNFVNRNILRKSKTTGDTLFAGDGTLSLRNFPNNQGTQPVRPWSNPAFIAAIQTGQLLIIAAASHQEVQNDRGKHS